MKNCRKHDKLKPRELFQHNRKNIKTIDTHIKYEYVMITGREMIFVLRVLW